jgi:xanthine dehydrogenase YagR molybdenum-binding subunit
MADGPFPDAPRIDAYDKVRGAPLYAADDARPDMAHAALAVATIGKGQVLNVDTAAARAVPGVRLILTHEDLAELHSPGFFFADGYGFQSFQPMSSAAIGCRGQPIALVAADTLEAAVEAAALISADYADEPFSVALDAPEADIIAQADSPLPREVFGDRLAGDPDAVFAAAEVKIDAVYNSPPQHQNPMECLASVVEWRDGDLVVHEGTQNAEAVRHGLARELGLPPERVHVLSPYCGGAFGQKTALQGHTVLAALAARELGRPVKLVVPRSQIFHDSPFRPASRHHMRLAADRSGRLLAAIHESDSQTSRHDLFPTLHTETSARLHGIANFRGHERLVRTDVQTPGFMRGPWEHLACFAMECAVDELACALDIDPVALRLANDTTSDPLTGHPFSSRHVADCLKRGAERFGWAARTSEPGSMRADDGSAVGWGVAVGAYPGLVVPEFARLEAYDDGQVVIRLGGHEMGQGVRTVVAAVVARKLGLATDRIQVEIGETNLSLQHLTAGSWGTASAAPVAEKACEALIEAVRALNPNGPPPNDIAAALKAAGRPSLAVEAHHKGPGAPDAAFDQARAGHIVFAGPNFPEFVSFSYIAHFVEVRVEPSLRRIRIPRVVSVADCGRVISPKTAESQVKGGVVWGIGATLREASEVDPRYGGFLNNDLAEYVIPVNADIGAIEVEFIDEPDFKLNSAGAKGLGEVAMTGVAPAIANAIYHATGRRLRDLPIRIEHLL